MTTMVAVRGPIGVLIASCHHTLFSPINRAVNPQQYSGLHPLTVRKCRYSTEKILYLSHTDLDEDIRRKGLDQALDSIPQRRSAERFFSGFSYSESTVTKPDGVRLYYFFQRWDQVTNL